MSTGFLSTRVGILILQVGAVIAILVAWQAVSLVGVFSTNVLPTPLSVAAAFLELLPSTAFWTAIGDTLTGALQGFAAGVLLGIPLGMLTGRVRFAEKSTRFLFEFGRAFPAIALLPVLVLVIGTNNSMKAVVVFLGVVFPMIIQAQHGTQRIEPSVLETVRAFRIPQGKFLAKVVLPTAAPYIATGIRLGATVAVLVAIGVEVLSGVPGVGRQLTLAQQQSAPDLAFAYIITAGILGFGVNWLVGLGKDRLIRWNANETED